MQRSFRTIEPLPDSTLGHPPLCDSGLWKHFVDIVGRHNWCNHELAPNARVLQCPTLAFVTFSCYHRLFLLQTTLVQSKWQNRPRLGAIMGRPRETDYSRHSKLRHIMPITNLKSTISSNVAGFIIHCIKLHSLLVAFPALFSRDAKGSSSNLKSLSSRSSFVYRSLPSGSF